MHFRDQQMETIPQNIAVSRNWRLLEFTMIFFAVVVCLWLIAPGINDSIKLGHETAVKHCASALSDSLRFLTLQRQASNENLPPHRALVALQNKGLDLRREDCQALWLGLLGPAAPSANIIGQGHFHITLQVDKAGQLGCRYGYTLAGKMFIDYFPMKGVVVVDDHF